MLVTLAVLLLTPLKCPATAKRLLHGACIHTYKNEATKRNLARHLEPDATLGIIRRRGKTATSGKTEMAT